MTGTTIKSGHTIATSGETTVIPTGPGRWLIEDDSADLEERLRKAVPAKKGSVTGLTHARVVVIISGEKAEWVLASGIAIDFSLDAFAVSTAKQGHHHEIGLTIHRTGEHSFELYVFTSLARALWGWVTRPARKWATRSAED